MFNFGAVHFLVRALQRCSELQVGDAWAAKFLQLIMHVSQIIDFYSNLDQLVGLIGILVRINVQSDPELVQAVLSLLQLLFKGTTSPNYSMCQPFPHFDLFFLSGRIGSPLDKVTDMPRLATLVGRATESPSDSISSNTVIPSVPGASLGSSSVMRIINLIEVLPRSSFVSFSWNYIPD